MMSRLGKQLSLSVSEKAELQEMLGELELCLASADARDDVTDET